MKSSTVFPEDLPFATNGLKALTDIALGIAYMPGDLDSDEDRYISNATPEQLIGAASMLRFDFQWEGQVARFIFDDDYIYELFLNNKYHCEVVEHCIALLEFDMKSNHELSRYHFKPFNLFTSQYFRHQQQISRLMATQIDPCDFLKSPEEMVLH